MFSLFRLDELAEAASKGLVRLNSRILQALGKRIAQAQGGGFDRLFLLEAADREADALYMEILKELDRSTATAGEVYAQAARLAYEGMNKYYAAKGLTQIPIEQQRAIVNFVNATASNTKNTFTNLSNTTAVGFRVMNLDGAVKYERFKTYYHNLVDQAISEVATGQLSYGSAVRSALRQTADSGIRILDYESGYSRRLDSAMRQNVLDGVKDIAHEVATRTGEQFGADGVEIDAHNYCAPDHLPFQGKQFKKSEFDEIQNSLPRQFGMWNCRHTFYPILLGASPPLYTEQERKKMAAQSTETIEFEGKKYTRYEATQLQRKIETSVRQSKDRAVIAKAAGDDLTRRVEQLRINQLKQKYGEITNVFKTPPALDRMSVSGFRPVKATLPRVVATEDDILPKPLLGQRFIPGTGQIELIVPSGLDLFNVRIIAGKGTSTPFRAASSWAEGYGGKPNEWQKIVGTVDGKHYSYEVHWVHHNGVKYELKIKRIERR